MVNTTKRRSLRILALIGMLLVVAAVGLMGWQMQANQPKATPAPVAHQTKGVALCLPHKDEGEVQTMECALGIKDGKGHYYALRDTDSIYKNIATLSINKQVTIEGEIEKTPDSQYPIEGTIHVTKVIPQ